MQGEGTPVPPPSERIPSPCICETENREKRKEVLFVPYVKRTVVAGEVIETWKGYTARIHTKGAKRAKNLKETEKAQMKCNERKAEEKLRWLLNANFSENDLHATLHYNDKPQTLEKVEEDARKFLTVLKKECKKSETVLKYVLVIETKRMSNPHIHIVLNNMSIKIVTDSWRKVSETGNVSFKPLDSRGNHAELAAYLIKESRSTLARWKSGQKHKKRFWCSQNLVHPEPKYEIIQAKVWKKEPTPRAGYALYKDKEGATFRSGVHEISGYEWQEYFEVKLPAPKPIRRNGNVYSGKEKMLL